MPRKRLRVRTCLCTGDGRFVCLAHSTTKEEEPMMRTTEWAVLDFWRMPWSRALREACREIGDHQPIEGSPLKNALAP